MSPSLIFRGVYWHVFTYRVYTHGMAGHLVLTPMSLNTRAFKWWIEMSYPEIELFLGWRMQEPETNRTHFSMLARQYLARVLTSSE